ncbi:hypothetical protein B566_EDAN010551 [Ephemera danica]|nr:hypothetical protein B566_EDAN010551 [Ephemera danica]
MGCGTVFMKSVLMCVNVIFLVFGAIIIASGAISYTVKILPDTIKTKDIPEDAFKIIGVFLIVVGCITFLTAFLGCCGAAHENKCMLMTYAVIVFLIMLSDIALATIAIVYRDKLVEEVNKIDELKDSENKIIGFAIATYASALFNIIQIIFACAVANRTG